ncbi:hypothetical protein NDU88_005895 [Pleurodeles waltl]|uniref:Uncharacterized protein n=1 Tax=Pleurodeles waltl TaxID=8319 RepID=A0AAV7TYN0_PLEWA|nr:hypothetical protein NDU88_005895 [Pleurodeles waltl]
MQQHLAARVPEPGERRELILTGGGVAEPTRGRQVCAAYRRALQRLWPTVAVWWYLRPQSLGCIGRGGKKIQPRIVTTMGRQHPSSDPTNLRISPPNVAQAKSSGRSHSDPWMPNWEC